MILDIRENQIKPAGELLGQYQAEVYKLRFIL